MGMDVRVEEVTSAYFEHEPTSVLPYGNGHINDTYLVTAGRRYILQRMNKTVFPHPLEVMENVIGVTSHIRRKAEEGGGDVARATLNAVLTHGGESVFVDSDGEYWRMYEFTERTVSRDRAKSAADFESCAEAFGNFQQLLADYPAESLHETIKNFHNTPWRYENLMASAERDVCGRLCECRAEVDFAREREEFCKTLEIAHACGEIPCRVTHNDTKLNNILFDETSGEAVCVIDLDTVMPGYSVNDFGDSIRFGANTAAEDERDLSLVSLDLALFEAYARGFLRGCNGSLTAREIALLPVGAIMMTLECGMRFLADHLDGDVYFKTHYDGHNLDRARCQFALVRDMEKKLPEMNEIINRLV